MSDHFTKPTAIVDGSNADADDINDLSTAVLTGFNSLETEVDGVLANIATYNEYVLLESGSAAGGVSYLEFDVDPSYTLYKFVWNDITLSTTCTIHCRVDLGAGIITTTDYHYNILSRHSNTTTSETYDSGATSMIVRANGIAPSSMPIRGETIARGLGTYKYATFEGQTIGFSTGVTDVQASVFSGVYDGSPNPITAVRFYPSAGEFSSGSIDMYGWGSIS